MCQKQPVPGCTQGSQVTRDWPTNCENMSSQGCTQGPRDTSVWPTTCCCEHTHVCCKIRSIQGCTQGRHITRVRPTRCRCEPTHMFCRIFIEYFSSTLHARVKRPFAAVSTHTHMCVSEQVNSSLHRKIMSHKVWPISCCCEHACAHFRIGQHRAAWITSYQGWPTSCCCERTHTHMCVLQKTCRVEPEDQGLPGGVANQALL